MSIWSFCNFMVHLVLKDQEYFQDSETPKAEEGPEIIAEIRKLEHIRPLKRSQRKEGNQNKSS